jgi:hypothetical protein
MHLDVRGISMTQHPRGTLIMSMLRSAECAWNMPLEIEAAPRLTSAIHYYWPSDRRPQISDCFVRLRNRPSEKILRCELNPNELSLCFSQLKRDDSQEPSRAPFSRPFRSKPPACRETDVLSSLKRSPRNQRGSR